MRVFPLAASAAVVLAGFGSTPGVRAADPSAGLKIQVVQGLFRDVPPGLVKVLGGPLRQLISKKTGIGGDIDLAPDALTLADRLQANQCQLGVFHGYEFAWAKARNPDLIPLVVTVYASGKPQACVVVNKNNSCASVAELKDGDINIPRGTKGHCFAYLARQRGCEVTAPKDKPLLSTEEALDAVVSGTSPAALVDVGAVKAYEKLQPGAAKNLKVLCKSQPFPQNVIAYNKGALSDRDAEQLRQVLVEAHTTSAGKPLMMLWNITSFAAVPADYEESLGASVKAYPCPGRSERTPAVRAVGMAP
jgi:ABC-type phosphate/phosphonate transport system substrate-binding protein